MSTEFVDHGRLVPEWRFYVARGAIMDAQTGKKIAKASVNSQDVAEVLNALWQLGVIPDAVAEKKAA